MLTVLLALSAALCWGSADFLAGRAARRVPLLVVLLVVQVAGLVVVGAAVVAGGHGPPGDGFLVPVLWGGVAATVGLGALYRGLAVGPMSVVAPISATAAAIPVVVGLATGDRPSVVQGAGIALALVGVALAAWERDEEGRPATAAGVGLALLSAAGLGCSLVALKAAADADPRWAALAFRLAVIVVIVVAIAARRSPAVGGRREVATLSVAGLFDGGAALLFATAFSRGLLSVVAVLGGLYPVITVILAQTLLHERLRRSQVAGVVAAMAGVGMIAAG